MHVIHIFFTCTRKLHLKIRLNVFLAAAGGVAQYKHSLAFDSLPPKLLEDCEKGAQLHSDLLNFCVESIVSSLRVVLRTFQLHVFSTTSTNAIMDHFVKGQRPSGSFPNQEMVMASPNFLFCLLNSLQIDPNDAMVLIFVIHKPVHFEVAFMIPQYAKIFLYDSTLDASKENEYQSLVCP